MCPAAKDVHALCGHNVVEIVYEGQNDAMSASSRAQA